MPEPVCVLFANVDALLCRALVHRIPDSSSAGINRTDGDVLLALGLSSQHVSTPATTCSEEQIQQYTEFVEHVNCDTPYISRINENLSDVRATDSCSCPEFMLNLKSFLEDHHDLSASKTYCSNLNETKGR